MGFDLSDPFLLRRPGRYRTLGVERLWDVGNNSLVCVHLRENLSDLTENIVWRRMGYRTFAVPRYRTFRRARYRAYREMRYQTV
jgi:hypothetical protein